MNTKGSLVAKHVPKHCGQSTHEDELNEGQCKNLDRNGMQGIFHTVSLQCLMQPLLCNGCIATPYRGLTLFLARTCRPNSSYDPRDWFPLPVVHDSAGLAM